MAVMPIRNIDDAVKNRLRLRAAMHGRSMEDEARDILRSALSKEIPRPRNLGQAINERFGALGASIYLTCLARQSGRWTSANDRPRHQCHFRADATRA